MICTRCKTEFLPENKRQVYCSERCKKRSADDRYRVNHPEYNGYEKRTPVERSTRCARCDKEFVAIKKNIKYCSESCRKTSLARECTQKRRAIKKRLVHDFTREQWEKTLEYFEKKCAYCGLDGLGVLHQDHFIPLSKGGEYTKNNIVPACSKCNSSKGNKHPLIWLAGRKSGFVKYIKIMLFLSGAPL